MVDAPLSPTLDQIAIFMAIVETGSFAGAARKLGRAPSVISYGVSNLESRLGLSLFTRAGSRRPHLTEAGRAILGDTRGIAMALDTLAARARGLNAGLEAEVSLVVDVMLPPSRLVAALDDFRRTFPTVSLRLDVEALGAVTERVLAGEAAFGISGPLEIDNSLLVRGPAGSVEMVAVATPAHPLARTSGTITGISVRDHIQLVLSDRSSLTAGRDFGVLATQSWRLADLGAKHALLLAGLGWGNMPRFMVDDDIAQGRLVMLMIEGQRTTPYPLHTVHRSAQPPGPAAAWLMARLARCDSVMNTRGKRK
jgi:DNA-binding transcriptional LysR family regulator